MIEHPTNLENPEVMPVVDKNAAYHLKHNTGNF
jgi:hypothetical protein